MHLLPSIRKNRIAKAQKDYRETGKLCICEPCDCGSMIRHNNGGNYHDIIMLRHDSDNDFVKFETTSELEPDAEWEICIEKYGDWL